MSGAEGGRWWRRARETLYGHPRRALGVVAGIVAVLVLLSWLIPDRVDTISVERRPVVETLVTTARVQSVSRTSLGSTLPGTAARVLVDEGDRVVAGQTVIELQDAELRATAAEARARVTAAEAALRGLGAEDLRTARAELEAAELEAQQLARNAERLRRVFAAGGISRVELEQAERLAEAAASRLADATVNVRSLSAGGATRSEADAALEAARSALAAAEARLGLTRVRAPASGTVLIRSVEPGDAVQPGRVLMEIALDGPTELIAFPDERSLATLRTGQLAVASADAYPDVTFRATVAEIAPVVDPRQGTVEVLLFVPEPPPYLLPDMTVSVNIELGRRQSAAVLPLDAVRAVASDTAWVMAVRDGRAVPVRVRVGARDGEYAEILAGLAADERVVANPTDVAAGQRVRARTRS